MSAPNDIAAVEQSGVPNALTDVWSRARKGEPRYGWMWVTGWLRKCERFSFRGPVAEEMLWLAEIAELLHEAEREKRWAAYGLQAPPCDICKDATCLQGRGCRPLGGLRV